MRNITRSKQLLKALLVLAAIAAATAACLQQSAKIEPPLTSTETPESPPVRAIDTSFRAFAHDVPEHKQFDCVSCHRREGSSRELAYTGHESCVGCHMSQFITNDVNEQNRAFCSICHSSLDSADPPMKVFPATFIEGFNMKFDHAAHDSGKGRPAEGCVACHNLRDPGETIPSGIGAHANCYGCHTAESKIGTCNVCHELSPYRRTVPSQYNFKAIFRHSDHIRGVGCGDCHTVRAGAAQSQQVSNIAIIEHVAPPGNNCRQCHNGQRAFSGSGTNVAVCARCHKGMVTTTLPSASVPDEAPQP
jgi:c(7)-type cytochrome triheme protein